MDSWSLLAGQLRLLDDLQVCWKPVFPSQTDRQTDAPHKHTYNLACMYTSPHKTVNLLKPKAVFNFDGRHGMGVSLSTRNDAVKRGTREDSARIPWLFVFD